MTDEDEILILNEKIDNQFISKNNIDMLISYNYRHIVDPDVLSALAFNAFNLHTSYLPFNRGAHPVLWSILENTPLGVTVHQINEGLDTGPIVFQKKLGFQSMDLSIRQVYDFVNQELINLFCQNWQRLRRGKITITPQLGIGSFHKKTQAEQFIDKLQNSWDTTIKDAKKRYLQFLESEKS